MRSTRLIIGTLCLLLWVTLGVIAPARAAVVVRDGSSAATAAASCWEIKQQQPQAPSGAYWLLTPTMTAPAQFFCDQSMAGGGWVLVGRGREGWDTYSRGQGNPEDLLTRTRTPEQFATVQLSDDTINGLLGGGAVADLADPIRIVRATDVAGANWQNVDLKPDRMTGWSWAFRSAHTAKVRFDGGRWSSSGNFRNRLGQDWGYYSLDMTEDSNRNYKLGYGYGPSLYRGSTSAQSFLWRNNSSALPYAEVYIRPQLKSTEGFSAIGDSGTAEQLVDPTVSDLSSPTRWGVVGNLTGSKAEGNAAVQAFAQLGQTMFVGGNFTGVQRGRNTSPVSRTALAAFDATTGEFISSFNVTFNNQVKDLLALPNGKLLVAGDFTQVNGSRHVGTVLLDPATGAVDESWDLQISNRLSSSGGRVSVRAMSLAGDRVYLGGSFTHLSGQGRSNVYGRAASRVDLKGKPDSDWNPEFNGTLMDIDTNEDLGRFYAAGYFTRTRSGEAFKAAVISMAAGAPIPVQWQYRPSTTLSGTYQQAVRATGSLVFFGGSQHTLQAYEHQNMTRVNGSITQYNGGDIQAIATDGVTLYAGCHCFDYAYENSFTYPDPGVKFTKASRIQTFGAWDAETGAQYSWTPYQLQSANAGAWSLYIADDGAVWAGGDFTGSRTTAGKDQWNGGWVRYPARDRQAPAAPKSLSVRGNRDGTLTLAWPAVEAGVTYQVLRDDRVVATTTATTLTLPVGGENRYFVRAVDSTGNVGASTTVASVVAGGQEEPAGSLLIAQADEWSYHYASQGPDANWQDPDFDDTDWPIGPAPLGYGSSDLATTFAPGSVASRPIASYYRHDFQLSEPQDLRLTYRADDGAVIYVNGVELTRHRMPQRPIDHETRAEAAVSAAQAEAEQATVVIPASALTAGRNVIAVEIHLNYRSAPSTSFAATLTTAADAE